MKRYRTAQVIISGLNIPRPFVTAYIGGILKSLVKIVLHREITRRKNRYAARRWGAPDGCQRRQLRSCACSGRNTFGESARLARFARSALKWACLTANNGNDTILRACTAHFREGRMAAFRSLPPRAAAPTSAGRAPLGRGRRALSPTARTQLTYAIFESTIHAMAWVRVPSNIEQTWAGATMMEIPGAKGGMRANG